MDAITQLVEQAKQTLITIAGAVAVIGFMSVGMMYVLSATPVLGGWRRDHPNAFDDVVKGILIITFAGGGGVAALLNF